jgi:metallo-beta-lactamase family protein
MLDAARLQEEDAEFKRRRHEREGRSGPFPIVPLYRVEDVEACLPLFTAVEYGQYVDLGFGLEAVLYEAGHVLGSSVVKIIATNQNISRSVLFSGDLGRPNRPIVRDPAAVHEADYILVESTYGDHVHHPPAEIKRLVADAVNRVQKRGGNLIVPSFALERSQELLYYVNELQLEGAIPHMMVFLDSPMAAEITQVFRRHQDLYDKEMTAHMRNLESPFDFPGLKITESAEESKAINNIKGTVMIISGSGMCTGGRIKHHLINNITRKESTIMFVGYQAMGTLGRHIADGAKKVRIHGDTYRVRAKVKPVHGFSAHADKNEILTWLQGFRRSPRRVFVVHGEAQTSLQFRDFLARETGWDVMAPAYQDEVILD